MQALSEYQARRARLGFVPPPRVADVPVAPLPPTPTSTHEAVILAFTRIVVQADPLADDELPRWPWRARKTQWIRDCRTIYPSPIGPPSLSHDRAWLILRAKAELYELTIEQIKGEQRKANIVHARHHAMWEMSKYTTWSLGQIGKFFGGKDHTTVHSAIKRHQARIDAGTVGP
jgi:hypothetical protein